MNSLGLINATGQPAVSGSFHTLVVQPTSFYNLDCTYCYTPIGLFRSLLAPSRSSGAREWCVTRSRPTAL